MFRFLRRFARDRSGNIAIITALTILPMTLITGGSLDLMRQETLRAKLQDALDRGVLAAASLSQTQDTKTTIRSYIANVIPAAGADIQITEEKTVNSRRISATVSYPYETIFLKLARIDTLNVPAMATAEEKRSNIELSLVLDISGSMVDNGGLAQLKPAAKSFIDTILSPDVRSVTSVNLIPFAGTVNIGADVYDFLAGSSNRRYHSYSSCFEMLDTDFADGMPDFTKRGQVPHFTYYNHGKKDRQPWWCPTEDAAVTLFSNDPNTLKNKIDALKAFDGTGTAYAIKWASILLDPAIQPSVYTASRYGIVDSRFSSRPSTYDDPDTLKFIVLMTDGAIGFQPRPKAGKPNPFDVATDANNFDFLFSSKSNTNQIASQYDRICEVVKKKGVTVFTIAFKVDGSTANKLAKCASSASNAYKVDGLDMSEAFRSIATAIQKIKLVANK